MIKISELVGKNARVKAGGTAIEGIRAWAIDYTADTTEITDFDDSGHKKFLATLDGWTGTLEGFGQPGWDTNVTVGNQYLGSFYVSTFTGEHYYGSIIVTGASPSQAVDAAGAISYSFQGTGALLYG